MENVTEELVRQNGNQAAAVMADYVGQGGGGGGSTGGASGVVIQGGGIVNGYQIRQATEADVAKFSGDSVGVGDSVIEINGVVPYVLQLNFGNGGPTRMFLLTFLLTSLDLTEHSVYYAMSGVASPNVNAEFKINAFIISDDATLLSPLRVE